MIVKMALSTAKCYGIRTIFSEHSLFGYNDAAGIHLNKLCKWIFKDLDAGIAVSNVTKENFCLRVKIDPYDCFTIPNAVDTTRFKPDLEIISQRP